jgi:hypothetical protein
MTSKLKTLVVSGVFALSAVSANAATVTIYETSTFAGNPEFVSSENGPLVGAYEPEFLPDDANSAWVADAAAIPGPTITYTVKFDLTGYDLNTVALSGLWGSVGGGYLSLNGVAINDLLFGPSSYETLTAYSDDLSAFLDGLNVLEFVVSTNDPNDPNDSMEVAAFRATVLVTSTPIAAVPLPAGLPMLAGAIGLLGLGAARRRKIRLI